MAFTREDLKRLAAPRPKTYNIKRDDPWTTEHMSVSEIISHLSWVYDNPSNLTPESIGHESIRQAAICLSKIVNVHLKSIFGLPVFPVPDYVACDHSFNDHPCCECGRYTNRKTIKGEDHGYAWREVARRVRLDAPDAGKLMILILAWKQGLVTGFQYFQYLDDKESLSENS